jgi:CTP:molybdopterin cytidylyltransferase MocA
LAARRLVEQGQASLLASVGDPNGQPVLERWGRLAVVILAAGAGSRFGAPKQLASVNGLPILVTALAAAATLPGPIYVVVGAHGELVQALLANLPAALNRQLAGRLYTLHNPEWMAGQASSLHVSLRNLPSEIEAAIWMPVDQPYLDPALLGRLATAWRKGADLAAPQVNGELRGAPALFDRLHWPELLLVQGDSGGRSVLRSHAAEVVAITSTDTSLRDIDSPADLT